MTDLLTHTRTQPFIVKDDCLIIDQVPGAKKSLYQSLIEISVSIIIQSHRPTSRIFEVMFWKEMTEKKYTLKVKKSETQKKWQVGEKT